MCIDATCAYFDDVVRRAATAPVVLVEAWIEAAPNRCHGNCEELSRRTRDYVVVRGWLVAGGHWLMPHSVVRRVATGELVDITPRSEKFPFVEHLRSEQDFILLRQGRDGGWLHPQPPAPFALDPAQFLSGDPIEDS